MPRPTRRLASMPRRAFTLVELLTVIGILAIVIAIIIPAMNTSRRTARMADSRSTLASLQNAISSFQNENRREPGYFGAKLMGSANNGTTAGFDSLSNIMLDLMGGVVAPTTTGTGIITVGPGTAIGTSQVKVDLAGFGATRQGATGATVKGYFVADQKRMVAQSGPGQRFGNGAGTGTDMLPSLVDAFGSPVLAWAQDTVPSNANFADMASPTQPSPLPGALFYWNQNAGFLNSAVTSLGKLAENQAFVSGGSVLASDNSGGVSPATTPVTTRQTATMWAMLGNPAAADPNTPTGAPARPGAARAPIMLHAAGPDGVYVGVRDKGGKAGYVAYTANQDAFNGTLFDDLIMTAGN